MNRRNSDLRSARSQRGVGLLEVLIAVLVMAIGLLGIAALQATALRNAESSMERSQAVVQTYGILDAMRANAASARSGAYNYAITAACAAPAASSLATRDVADWLTAVKASMGADACGGIACDANSCTVQVKWNDSRASAGASDAASDSALTITTRTKL